ncbi:TrkA family potassium uptake protein [Nocardia sp. BMG111209]|uniref:potassium channel family protein n=1 Tax=Nocardia sp. BMG111209 TaxID=1160137 RepID=UPI0009DB94B6|nr:potassium channel protein [Nocardia sp. BMG111209]
MEASPWAALTRRVAAAVLMLVASTLVVYFGRGGYHDVKGTELSLLDSAYYATVSLSTTGYGDITPITPVARLINIVIITPLRVLFLIVLVGTTLQVLTERSRQAFKIQRWRRKVRNHTVVVGYGTKGRTAVDAMLGDRVQPAQIVVVDTDPIMLKAAANAGLVTVHGSATQADVLRLAGVQRAAAVVVAVNRDDSAVMVTLTARELNPTAKIVASIRESENTHLLKQSGADSVVVSSETAGRLLGIATNAPNVVDMIENLLTPEEGLTVTERDIEPGEVGVSPRHLGDIVLGVDRAGTLIEVGDSRVDALEAGDKLLYLRRAHG